MMKQSKFLLITLFTTLVLSACGGNPDDALPGDTSTDPIAPFIGSWESECYSDDGASARLYADFSKVSPTGFTGKITGFAYAGTSCSGPSVKNKDVLTNMSMAIAGTKTVEGVQATLFNGTSDQGVGKTILYSAGSTLKVGDDKSAKDAAGYPSAFYTYTFNRR